MRIFVSAGEPSGDLHAGNLILTLRRLAPQVECLGFGGDRMEAAQGHVLFPLSQYPVMGVLGVLANARVFARLLEQANRVFQRQRPDAVVLIDYPGFNWWIARLAHARRIPVFYFVPPQLWAWASWRVRKMKRWVDHVLCNLPFEQPWYRRRGIAAHYVGHPYFDELAHQQRDEDFLAQQIGLGSPIVGLLPGSRTLEVKSNLPTLLRSAELLHASRPDIRFLIACFKPAHQELVQAALRGRHLPSITPYVGRTPEIIHLSTACVAVSGSVGLELLYHGKPSAILYRVSTYHRHLVRWLVKCPYISLVNLLAGKELFPEYLRTECPAAEITGHVLGWLNDPEAYATISHELAELRRQVAVPGACERAAQYILEQISRRTSNHVGLAA